MTFTKQADFTKKVTDLTDVPSQNMTPSQIKSYFQTPADELKTTVNKLVDDLNGSGWVDTPRLGSKVVTREKVASGAIGVNEIDPSIMNQPTTAIGVQAKLDDHTAQLADIVTIKPSGDITGATDTANINSAVTTFKKIRLAEGKFYITNLTFLKNINIEGRGKNKTILQHAGTGTAVWFGNYTEDTPLTVYDGRNNKLTDLSIFMNKNSKVGLRIRENHGSVFDDVFAGYENLQDQSNKPTDGLLHVGLIVDGAINCKFKIESSMNYGYTSLTAENTLSAKISQSLKLNHELGGSGNGSSITSSSFDNSYFHYARQALYVNGNSIDFNNCIFEACVKGIITETPFAIFFNDCYYEAITESEFEVIGADNRNRAGNVVIKGGYTQRKDKGGIDYPFAKVQNIEKIKISDVQMNGYISQAKTVDIQGFCGSCEIDANPLSLYGQKKFNDYISLTNAFSVDPNNKILKVNKTNHGFKNNMMVDLIGFDVVGNNNVNLPDWVVTVVDTDNFTLTNKYIENNFWGSVLTGVGGTGTLRWYGSGVWNNSQLQAHPSIKFNDAIYKEIKFNRNFANGIDNGVLYLDGITSIYDTMGKFGYITKIEVLADTTQNVTRYVQVFAQDGDFTPRSLGVLDFSGSIQYKKMDAMHKVRPNEKIVCKVTLSGAAGSSFPQNITVKVTIAELPYTSIVES